MNETTEYIAVRESGWAGVISFDSHDSVEEFRKRDIDFGINKLVVFVTISEIVAAYGSTPTLEEASW